MLGSHADADDAVQETWLRLSRANADAVENLSGWLTTVVLHDIFAVPFDEIAPVVGRSSGAARQIASRARRRLQGAGKVGDNDLNRGRAVAAAFLAASRAGDFDALLGLLDPDVVVRSDATGAGAKPLAQGAVAVATWFSKGARGLHGAVIDGAPGIVWAPDGQLQGVLGLTVTDGTIVEINLFADADGIRRFDTVLVDG